MALQLKPIFINVKLKQTTKSAYIKKNLPKITIIKFTCFVKRNPGKNSFKKGVKPVKHNRYLKTVTTDMLVLSKTIKKYRPTPLEYFHS